MEQDSDITKELWKELQSSSPSEDRVRELVIQGADISKDFLSDAIGCLVPPIDMWEFRGKPIDLKFFRLFIALGADVNYKVDNGEGFNCLYDAALSWNVELVKILLEAGADPNSYDAELHQPILSYVHTEQWLEKITWMEDRGGLKALAEIEELIKQYGGKY